MVMMRIFFLSIVRSKEFYMFAYRIRAKRYTHSTYKLDLYSADDASLPIYWSIQASYTAIFFFLFVFLPYSIRKGQAKWKQKKCAHINHNSFCTFYAYQFNEINFKMWGDRQWLFFLELLSRTSTKISFDTKFFKHIEISKPLFMCLYFFLINKFSFNLFSTEWIAKEILVALTGKDEFSINFNE